MSTLYQMVVRATSREMLDTEHTRLTRLQNIAISQSLPGMYAAVSRDLDIVETEIVVRSYQMLIAKEHGDMNAKF